MNQVEIKWKHTVIVLWFFTSLVMSYGSAVQIRFDCVSGIGPVMSTGETGVAKCKLEYNEKEIARSVPNLDGAK